MVSFSRVTILASKKKEITKGKNVVLPTTWVESLAKRHDQFPSIKDSRYTWILDEVAFYAFEFMIVTRVVKLTTTFNFCCDGLTTLPCSLNQKVFSWPGEKEDNFVYIYKYF